MIVVTAYMTARQGVAQDLAALAAEVVRRTRADEKDCQSYDCFQNISVPEQFVFVEEWPDSDALRNHGGSEHHQAFAAAAAPLLAEREVKIHTVEKTRVM